MFFVDEVIDSVLRRVSKKQGTVCSFCGSAVRVPVAMGWSVFATDLVSDNECMSGGRHPVIVCVVVADAG